jgi:hypothetical protein
MCQPHTTAATTAAADTGTTAATAPNAAVKNQAGTDYYMYTSQKPSSLLKLSVAPLACA